MNRARCLRAHARRRAAEGRRCLRGAMGSPLVPQPEASLSNPALRHAARTVQLTAATVNAPMARARGRGAQDRGPPVHASRGSKKSAIPRKIAPPMATPVAGVSQGAGVGIPEPRRRRRQPSRLRAALARFVLAHLLLEGGQKDPRFWAWSPCAHSHRVGRVRGARGQGLHPRSPNQGRVPNSIRQINPKNEKMQQKKCWFSRPPAQPRPRRPRVAHLVVPLAGSGVLRPPHSTC